MNSRLAHVLMKLYPAPWRARYGDEFHALLRDASTTPAALLNVMAGALREHLIPQVSAVPSGAANSASVFALARRPSVYLPLAMSVAALLLLLTFLLLAYYKVVPLRAEDEGLAAHVWQLLIAGQLPVLGYFALRWIPRRPVQAVVVLGVQGLAAMVSIVPVFWLQI